MREPTTKRILQAVAARAAAAESTARKISTLLLGFRAWQSSPNDLRRAVEPVALGTASGAWVAAGTTEELHAIEPVFALPRALAS